MEPTSPRTPSTRSSSQKLLGEKAYVEQAGFPNGILPTNRDVVQNMMYLMRPGRAGQSQRSKAGAAHILSAVLMDHWIFCNVYTVSDKIVKKKILNLYNTFQSIVQTRQSRRNQTYEENVKIFNASGEHLFDIYCEDSKVRKNLEEIHGVKMSQSEMDFLNDMRGPRKMYCESFVDRKWMQSMARRSKDQHGHEKRKEKAENDRLMSLRTAELSESGSESASESHVSEYEDMDSDEPSTSKPKRRKLVAQFVSQPQDPLPPKYQHIRTSVRGVRSEVYESMDHMKSVFHMSQNQAEGAVITVGNKMFERKWKMHSESTSIDLDTLQAPSNTREAGKSLEMLALDEIVKEVMTADSKSTVTYSDDGSKKQGVGSFSVQGLTIDGKYRPLPTLPIASESRSNLAELKMAVFSIMEAASGVASKDLFEKIDFVITDQTAHNVGVEDLVAEKLESEHLPQHLFCNVHPSLMFNRVLTKQWTEIENAIGRDKIYSTFLVNATSNSSSVTEQALDCITRLINHDFDNKNWNKANEFDGHIAPRSNKSVSLKDERFNRLTLTCAITIYHLDDVASYLNKFQNVTNQLACIVRCFIDLGFLKILYCTGALIGLHLVEPFLSLTTSTSTTYSKLIPAFKQLYLDLNSTDPVKLLNLNEPAFDFVSKRRFDENRYDDEICQAIDAVITELRPEILAVLKLLLPKLAEGFKHQKGSIFGFDEEKESPHALGRMDAVKLESAPIHNLDSERSVGFVNYELSRRGAKQLQSASGTQVKAKSADLIQKRESGSFKQYKALVKSGGRLPEIMTAWNEQQQKLMQDGLQVKEVANIAVDKRRNADLEVLKKHGGPFTNSREVNEFIENTEIDYGIKSNRMYLEVRYARDTALSVPKTSDIFRLKKDYKNLPTEKYATNLKLYLDNVSHKTDVSMADFKDALRNMEHTDN